MLSHCNPQTSGDNQRRPDSAPKGVFDIAAVESRYDGLAKATFAGGCFWCTEAIFERVHGVKDVISGYTGGDTEYPTYEQVASGRTTHAEAVRIYFDPEIVSFQTLLEVFFATHDPTQLNRQGPDVGPQYRSAVFCHDERQKQTTLEYMRLLREEKSYSQPIVTQVQAAGTFYQAEEYHQDYYEHHPENPYIQKVTRPKVEKFLKNFQHLLKAEYKA
jgi:peptide-methionine (S)-S-oxide reductase